MIIRDKIRALFKVTPPPDEVRDALIATLLTRSTSLAVSEMAGLVVSLSAFVRLHSDWCLIWTALNLLVFAGRFGLVDAYREQRWGAPNFSGHFVTLHAVGGVASSLVMGIGAAVCLLTGDIVLSLLAVVTVTGTAGGLASRNAGLPRTAMAQIAASQVPIAIGAMMMDTSWYWLLTAEVILNIIALGCIAQGNHEHLVHLMSAEQDNAKLLSRFRHLAQHDPLTVLSNRAHFVEQLTDILKQLPETVSEEDGIAVFYLDLDSFKAVNDSLGHAAGDALLCAVAERLRRAVRQGDIVARLGGDEFAVIQARASRAGVEALARRLATSVARPYDLGPGWRAQTGVSIGIALAPEHGREPDDLLQKADMALYSAKVMNKGTFCIFDPLMQARAWERRTLEADLRQAVVSGEGLQVHYQPIIDFSTGEVSAREALLRWYHPARGMISPGDFIPIAEESGIIVPLGEWVMRRACEDAAQWTDTARVAVNVSAAQLGRASQLPDVVAEALAVSGLPPSRLEIEVTESVLLQSDPGTLGHLQKLRALGVSIALDDFGTGFASLAYLRNFNFDRIKIEGCFVRDASQRPECAAIVRAVADLARRLGVTTVAEGVETEEQLALVRNEGCSEAQGYLLGRPQPFIEPRPRLAVAPTRKDEAGGAGSQESRGADTLADAD